jgi:hypothetical protein
MKKGWASLYEAKPLVGNNVEKVIKIQEESTSLLSTFRVFVLRNRALPGY